MRVQANLAHGAPDQTDRAERWLADHVDEIAEAYDGPEDVAPGAQDTARGNRVCRVAVYRSGCVGQMAPVESAEWFVDLLVQKFEDRPCWPGPSLYFLARATMVRRAHESATALFADDRFL